jgi:hypothetical protein
VTRLENPDAFWQHAVHMAVFGDDIARDDGSAQSFQCPCRHGSRRLADSHDVDAYPRRESLPFDDQVLAVPDEGFPHGPDRV